MKYHISYTYLSKPNTLSFGSLKDFITELNEVYNTRYVDLETIKFWTE